MPITYIVILVEPIGIGDSAEKHRKENEMYKVVIWGIGNDYETIYNQLLVEQYKGNIRVEALVARREDIYVNRRDGHPIIAKEQLRECEFDYVIVASSRFFDEIVIEAISIGIDRKKIINGKVFLIPNFDFIRYANLIENPISIISDDCWGGYLYHLLCLPFSSPTINMYFSPEHFIKFVRDIKYYVEQPLFMQREGNLREGRCPVGIIGKGDKQITLMFNHVALFADAEEEWNKRKTRINHSNIFVKMTINADYIYKWECLESFKKIAYKKVCFCTSRENLPDAVSVTYLQRFGVENKRYGYQYKGYIRNMSNMLYGIDIFKLLNGESDFLRE